MTKVSSKPEQKPILDKLEAARKRDALPVAQLLLDIWQEKKRKEQNYESN